jgi:parallel beta-helix repeat protein
VTVLAGSAPAIGQHAAVVPVVSSQAVIVSSAPPPCTGVQIFPGMTADAIQNLVDVRPAGTVFCFASGTYLLNHYITLKDGNQFICPVRRTCVLTGLDLYRGAFDGDYGTSHQLIQGFVVEHFVLAADTWPVAGIQVRDFGVVQDNEVRYNEIGIEVGSNQTISGNFIHHNRRYGLSGGPGNNILIEGNELSWNNAAHLDPNVNAGGSKIIGSQVGTQNLTWRNNHVHDNYGVGIWSDGNVRNALYERNVIENNAGPGIFHEISWDAIVRDNVVRRNNTLEQGLGMSCWHGAQIALNNSQNVVISGNIVEAIATNAICLANAVRQETAAFPQALANITVSNNVIGMRGEVSMGMVGETLPVNVTFSGNTYYVDNLTRPNWTYMLTMTRAQWEAAGHDTAGKFLPW